MASSQESHPCSTCGGQASLRCGRCCLAWYCSRQCQEDDYPNHKTLCRTTLTSTPRTTRPDDDLSMDVLLPNFQRHSRLRCIECGKLVMMCPCEGSSPELGVFFVMPPVPPELTFRQRISRWALLVVFHPDMCVFDATRFVKDKLPGLESDMEFVKPIIIDHMEKYKRRNFDDLADKMKVLPGKRDAFLEEAKGNADYAVENFFAGNWGYLSVFEYTLLYNSFDESNPEEHDAVAYPRFLNVLSVVESIRGAFQAAGIPGLRFCLEDLENFKN